MPAGEVKTTPEITLGRVGTLAFYSSTCLGQRDSLTL